MRTPRQARLRGTLRDGNPAAAPWRLLILPLLLFAFGRCRAETQAVAATLDAGGQRITGSDYALVGSLGAVGGAATGGAGVTLKAGYVGQLTDAASLAILAPAAFANEGASVQLGAAAELDDATTTVLSGRDVYWLPTSHPVSGIHPDGTADTLPVFSNTWGLVAGSYQDATGTVALLVVNSDPDNYGLYAEDDVPDAWQIAYFGIDNPEGTASAINATGQNNRYAYIADLVPTNAQDCFRVTAVSNLPSGRVICFGSSSAARVYRLLYAESLTGSAWTNLPGAPWQPGEAGHMSLSDTHAAPLRFYRVQVALPGAE